MTERSTALVLGTLALILVIATAILGAFAQRAS